MTEVYGNQEKSRSNNTETVNPMSYRGLPGTQWKSICRSPVQLDLDNQPDSRREEYPEDPQNPPVKAIRTDLFIQLAVLVVRIESRQRNKEENRPEGRFGTAVCGQFLEFHGCLIEPVNAIDPERNYHEAYLDPHVSVLHGWLHQSIHSSWGFHPP